MTSGHCDAHDGSTWTYGDDHAPLGKNTAGEYAETLEGSQITDAALIRLASAYRRATSPASIRYTTR